MIWIKYTQHICKCKFNRMCSTVYHTSHTSVKASSVTVHVCCHRSAPSCKQCTCNGTIARMYDLIWTVCTVCMRCPLVQHWHRAARRRDSRSVCCPWRWRASAGRACPRCSTRALTARPILCLHTYAYGCCIFTTHQMLHRSCTRCYARLATTNSLSRLSVPAGWCCARVESTGVHGGVQTCAPWKGYAAAACEHRHFPIVHLRTQSVIHIPVRHTIEIEQTMLFYCWFFHWQMVLLRACFVVFSKNWCGKMHWIQSNRSASTYDSKALFTKIDNTCTEQCISPTRCDHAL